MTNDPINQVTADGIPHARPKEPGRLSPIGLLAVGLVRLYQIICRPLMGNHCRFYPSCSDYMILAVKKHGFFLGVPKGIWRVCRCHPFHPGGVDYP